MKLSFVIPAYNEEAYIGRCLESIVKALGQKPAGYEAEIIVINNASTDRTKEIAESVPGVRVVDEPNKGLTKARQRGLQEAQGELLAYIDADSYVAEHWFPIMEHEFATKPKLVSLSGPYRYYDLSGWKKFLAELGWDIAAPTLYFFAPYIVLGGNFTAKKEALIAMGGFDASIDFYGEDMDIAWRLHELGTVLFRMDFFVYSSGRRLTGEGLFKTYLVYAINSLWEVIFHRPFTKTSKDIR